MRENNHAINDQIICPRIWRDVYGHVTKWSVVGGKHGFDLLGVLGLVVPEMLDQTNLFPQVVQVVPLVLADKQLSSTPEHDGIIVMAPEFPPAGGFLHMVGCFTKQALQGPLQEQGLAPFLINHLFTFSSGIK